MDSPAPATSAMPPWWVRYTRWSQTSLPEATQAERGLLSLVPGPWHVGNVRVGPGNSDWLHTISNQPLSPSILMPAKARGSCRIRDDATSAAPPAPSAATSAAPSGAPLVLLPGYGAASGFYFRNMGDLASAARLYMVDWLGTGLSGRPKFTARSRQETEDFFVHSLAAWKQRVLGDETRMVLVGHSLGGYLSAVYALRHPEHVAHLILVCPAGVPKAPEDWQKNFLGGVSGVRGFIFRSAMRAWEAGFTPHTLVRALGPWGPGLTSRYVSNRFTHHGDGLSGEEAAHFQQYFYSTVAQPGSGEYALRHLLAPGAWAYEPLSTQLRNLEVPVTFVYGEHDWMRPSHAVELCQELRKERPPKDEHDLSVEVVPSAGHFVFLDQPHLFNTALLRVARKYIDSASASSRGSVTANDDGAGRQGGGQSAWDGPEPAKAATG